MSIYGNKIINIEEASDMKELEDEWKTANQNHSKKVFKSNVLSENEYNNLFDLRKIMKTTDDYTEYKKAFEKVCRFCHIVPRGTIITKFIIKSGSKENKNSVLVEYSYNTKKIKLPEGMKLYHLSKVEGITELQPQFRGKSAKGYFYDKPRIYFTIHKRMPKFLADYKIHEKMHKYECKVPISDVYVDPLVWNKSFQGAVYVEINKPVPVEEMGIKKNNPKPDKSKEDQENNSEK